MPETEEAVRGAVRAEAYQETESFTVCVPRTVTATRTVTTFRTEAYQDTESFTVTVPVSVQRQAAGDAVQPAARGGRFADGAGLAGQHQEGGLKGVGQVGPGAEDALADAMDQRSVTPDQRFKGSFVPRLGEAVQQLVVAQIVVLACNCEDTEVLEHGGQTNGSHGWSPRDGLLPT
jgi:hypothetical protein